MGSPSAKEALLDLADRCEKATGPDDSLDWAIAEGVRCAPGLPYSSSLDAAMTLVPKPAWVRMDEWPADFCHGPVASVQPIREPKVEAHAATGSTLALALCAAALRAQSEAGQ